MLVLFSTLSLVVVGTATLEIVVGKPLPLFGALLGTTLVAAGFTAFRLRTGDLRSPLNG